jgi:hypothetical protein
MLPDHCWPDQAELFGRFEDVFCCLFFCHNSIVYFYEEKLAETTEFIIDHPIACSAEKA